MVLYNNGDFKMDFNAIVTLLDGSPLTRESVTVKNRDDIGVTWRNLTENTLSATVDGTEHTDLIQVCLVNDGESVDIYINDTARWKLTKYDLENVSTFSIS